MALFFCWPFEKCLRSVMSLLQPSDVLIANLANKLSIHVCPRNGGNKKLRTGSVHCRDKIKMLCINAQHKHVSQSYF